MAKTFVVAGSYEQFRHWRMRKIKQLSEQGASFNIQDFVYVSNVHTLFGYNEIHGVFIGSFRERSDIQEIVHIISRTNQCPVYIPLL